MKLARLAAAVLVGAAAATVMVPTVTAALWPTTGGQDRGAFSSGPLERQSSRAPEIPRGLDLYRPIPPDNPLTPEKIVLGRKLFFDTRLSVDGSASCATCHRPELAFTDGRPLALGVHRRVGLRNTPTLVNRVYGARHFFDGRAEGLEEQVLQPIENGNELGFDIDEALRRLRADGAYEPAFVETFGRPIDASAMAQALASYVRSIMSGDSPFDRYLAGDESALSPEQVDGMRIFTGKGRCSACHVGPNFTDEEFHNTGVVWGAGVRREPDVGRFAVTGDARDFGAFKTPTLREIAHTAPYMHNGSIGSLEEVVDYYSRGGNSNPDLDRQIRPLGLSAAEKAALVSFLLSLSGQVQAGGEPSRLPRVIVIGIDGMGSDNVWRDTDQGVPPPAIPNIERLKETGAYSLRAGIDRLNFSGPNWAGMVTGSDSSEHGVETNDCTRGAALPTIYEVLHERFPQRRLAVVHEWTHIACYYDPSSVGFRVRTENEQETADRVIELLNDDGVIFTFVYMGYLDRVGHAHGGSSREYVDKLEYVDYQIGRILDAIAADSGGRDTYVILTADHGHLPGGGGHSSNEAFVPFIVTGPGVAAGELDAQVRNNQVAPLVAHLFGIEPSPAWGAKVAPFDGVISR